MRVLHCDGFTKADMEMYRDVLRANALQSMQLLVRAIVSAKGRLSRGLRGHADKVLHATSLSPDVTEAVTALWASKEIKRAFDARAEERYFIPSAAP